MVRSRTTRYGLCHLTYPRTNWHSIRVYRMEWNWQRPCVWNNYVRKLTMSQPSSISWNWKTQYHLAIGTDPAGLDPQPKPSSPGPWYDGGTLLICTAQNISGKLFDHWTVKSLTTDQLSDWEHGISQITLTIDGPYEAVAHYVPAPAWWNNVQIILALAGVLTVSFVGAAWITTRRRRVS